LEQHVPVDTERDAQTLLARIRAGDREAAAEFLDRYRERIQRRIRGKLGPAMRRLFDSQEILSTLGRRLDHGVRTGDVRAVSVEQLLSYVFTIADHSLIEKARLFRALEAREGEDGPLAHRMADRLREVERARVEGPLIEIDAALRSLHDGEDRQILSMWLMGQRLIDIADDLGIEYAATRKRWEKIRGRLRELFESGGC
jgi:DNA-directed RNA polymerase specialized sigma24 family protein